MDIDFSSQVPLQCSQVMLARALYVHSAMPLHAYCTVHFVIARTQVESVFHSPLGPPWWQSRGVMACPPAAASSAPGGCGRGGPGDRPIPSRPPPWRPRASALQPTVPALPHPQSQAAKGGRKGGRGSQRMLGAGRSLPSPGARPRPGQPRHHQLPGVQLPAARPPRTPASRGLREAPGGWQAQIAQVATQQVRCLGAARKGWHPAPAAPAPDPPRRCTCTRPQKVSGAPLLTGPKEDDAQPLE